MSKYIDIEKLIAEIEKSKNKLKSLMSKFYYAANFKEWEAERQGYDNVLSIIDFLKQEQPEVDLEKEVKRWKNKHGVVGMDDLWLNFARHFYELGQSEMRERIANPEYNKIVLEKMKFEYPLDENNARKEE